MATIESSSKLCAKQDEYCICSKCIVFFRVVDEGSHLRVMTATASEDSGTFHPFCDQQQLIEATRTVFYQFDIAIVEKRDHAGKPYVEAKISTSVKHVEHITNTVLLRLGVKDIATRALSELKALYEELAIDDTGGDAYLEGGVSLTADGRLVE